MKLRLRYEKLGPVRFVGHRDVARVWERAVRKAHLPIAYTEGFTPRPRLGFGLALPTGAESVAEYIDVDLAGERPVDPADPALAAGLTEALPPGMRVTAIAEREPGAMSLQEAVTSSTWELVIPDVAPELLDAARQRLLNATALPVERERKGRRHTDDVRGLILDLRVAHPTLRDRGATCLVADLVTVGRALRPTELVAVALPDLDVNTVAALRTHQWLTLDGERQDVIPLADTRDGADHHSPDAGALARSGR